MQNVIYTHLLSQFPVWCWLMTPAHGRWIAMLGLTSKAKASLAILQAQQCRHTLLGMLRGLCALVTVTRGILSTSTDHRPAPPGPEKSTARIYRFTLDWLSRICTPINTFTALLMPLLGINKVTADKMRLRFSWQLGQQREGNERGGVMSEKGGGNSHWG